MNRTEKITTPELIPDDVTEKTKLSPKISRKRLQPVDSSVVENSKNQNSKTMVKALNKNPENMSKTFNIVPVKRKWLIIYCF